MKINDFKNYDEYLLYFKSHFDEMAHWSQEQTDAYDNKIQKLLNNDPEFRKQYTENFLKDMEAYCKSRGFTPAPKVRTDQPLKPAPRVTIGGENAELVSRAKVNASRRIENRPRTTPTNVGNEAQPKIRVTIGGENAELASRAKINTPRGIENRPRTTPTNVGNGVQPQKKPLRVTIGEKNAELASRNNVRVVNNIRTQAQATQTNFANRVAQKGGTVAARGGATVARTTTRSNGLVARTAETSARFDRALDSGAQKLNNTKAGQVYNKAIAAAGNTKAGKAVAKTTTAVVTKAANTTAGKAVTKVVAKTVGTTVGKTILKKIPVVCAVAGCCFAYGRIKKGEWKAAGAEVLSGIAGCFPGLGTGISFAIDGTLAANDIHKATKANKKAAPAKKPAVKPQAKYVAKAQPKPVKQATKTPVKKQQLTQAQISALKQRQSYRA